MNTKTARKGFTLIELLVVIAIIGVLASVVLASLNTARQKSRDAKRVSDINQIKLALEMQFDKDGEYPDKVADISTDFLASEPKDTSTNTSYPYDNYDDSTRSACAVADAGSCAYYHLGAKLEQGADSGALKGDRDLEADAVAGGPDGLSTLAACADEGGIVAATDLCYDVVP